jgi:16S rRNA processing protein RimM
VSNNLIVQGTLVIGRITAVFGVRGWVKIKSFTEQPEKIFNYQPWLVDKQGVESTIEVEEWKVRGDGLVARLKGIDDRDVAREWCQLDIRVEQKALPDLQDSEYYWHQLQDLVVYNHYGNSIQRLGRVSSMLETGANDVIVVTGDAESIDRKERLIPYAKQYVTAIDLESKKIVVIWDPDF